jgi:late competence protein required for DNA uptake (superfamily II DNA/RNA helicase)
MRKQVRQACTRCREAHTACSSELPCSRCVSLGMADSCVYGQHKRRGRRAYRLEESHPYLSGLVSEYGIDY